MSNNSINLVIPVPQLSQAEEYYPDAALLIGAYLDSIVNNDFSIFYDRVHGIPNDGLLSEDTEESFDFHELCDQVESAMCYLSNTITTLPYLTKNYEVLNSYKIDDSSVVVVVCDMTK